ncbi:unnamed protein product [Tenebrio molitor]|nr:unnamed protein product [Tenebrio molitor]
MKGKSYGPLYFWKYLLLPYTPLTFLSFQNYYTVRIKAIF